MPLSDEGIKTLVKWIAWNSESESGFLTPEPQHHVHTESLVDEIQRLTGIPKPTLGEWINEEADAKDSGDYHVGT